MKIVAFIFSISLLLTSIDAQRPRAMSVQLKITSRTQSRAAANIVLSVDELRRAAPDLTITNAVVQAFESDRPTGAALEIPSQLDDLDGDGAPDELVFQLPLAPKTTRRATIVSGARAAYPTRAYAKFAEKYEGMGWESERTAWRLYFDPRNAIDLFGKRTPGLSLDYFGSPGVNYHNDSPNGRDIYRIGASLGIGAVGAWIDGKAAKVGDVKQRRQRVISAGPVRAVVELQYLGWNLNGQVVNLTSRITQWAAERGFEHQVRLDPADGVVLVAGLPRQPGLAELLTPPKQTGEVYCLGTWGHQVLAPGASATTSLPDQNLGLAILVPDANARHTISDDASNYMVRVPLQNGVGRWYVTAAWDQEQSAAKSFLDRAILTQEQFTAYLKAERDRLEHPPQIKWLVEEKNQKAKI